MDKKRNETALFLILIALAFVMFLLDRWGVFVGVRALIEDMLSPSRVSVQRIAFSIPFLSHGRISSLEEERNALQEKLVTLEKLEKENEDLRLQLGIRNDGGQKLMLAHVLSTGRFFIIDKGQDDGVRPGYTVTFKNILVGRIVSATKKTSRVLTPLEEESIISAKAGKTEARGLLKGKGDRMLFSEVTLSEHMVEADIIMTIGDVDEKGLGVRPDLLIGTLTAIRKSDDQLFQEATVVPLLDYKALQNIFVVL